MKITNRVIDTAKPGIRDALIWDKNIVGFGLKVIPAGKKVFVVSYRFRGRIRRYTLGRYGSPWTPDEAPSETMRLLWHVSSSVDPADLKAQDKSSPVVSDLFPRFLAEVEVKSKAGTTKQYRRIYGKFILPVIGRRRVSDMTRTDVARLHHPRSLTPTPANLALATLSAFSTWTEQQRERPDGANPVRHVKPLKESPRKRFVTGPSLKDWETHWQKQNRKEPFHRLPRLPFVC